jgi:hypothetical protein
MNLTVIMMLLGPAVVALIAFELLKFVRELVSKAVLSKVKEFFSAVRRHCEPWVQERRHRKSGDAPAPAGNACGYPYLMRRGNACGYPRTYF